MLILALVVSAGLPGPSDAAPASPDGQDVLQPDGHAFHLYLLGDEYFSWHETEDGYAAAEPTNRCWHAPDVIGTQGFFRLRGILKP